MIKYIHLQDQGIFTISCVGNPAGSTTYSYHVIAGGGGAGRGYGSHGGAGGFRSGGCFGPSPLRVSAVTAVATDFPITVGAGGAGQPPSPYGPGVMVVIHQDLVKQQAGGGGGAGAVAGPSHGANGRPVDQVVVLLVVHQVVQVLQVDQVIHLLLVHHKEIMEHHQL